MLPAFTPRNYLPAGHNTSERQNHSKGLTVVDLSDIAQSCNVYSELTAKAAATPEPEYEYLGIAVYGNKNKVNKLTGSMPLLR